MSHRELQSKSKKQVAPRHFVIKCEKYTDKEKKS